MQFINTTTDSVIVLNEATAINLKSVSDRTVVYSIEFQVDLNEAARKNDAFQGKIYFSKVPKQTAQPIFSRDINGNDSNRINQQPRPRRLDGSQNLLSDDSILYGNQIIIDEIGNLNNRRRAVIRRNDENILQTLNFSLFDFTSRENIQRAKENNFSREEEVLVSETFQDIASQTVFERLPPGQPNLLTQGGQLSQTLSSQTVTREMRNAIKRNVDPVSLIGRTNGIISAPRAIGGTFTPPSALRSNQDPGSSVVQQALTLTPNFSSETLIGSDSYLTRRTTITSTKVIVNLDFELNSNLLSGASTIYFEIELNDNVQRPVYNKVITINHARNLEDLLVPRFAPRITGFYRKSNDGKIILTLRQIDPTATSILLYSREFAYDEDYSQPYLFLAKIPITVADGEKTVRIPKSLNKRTSIRAISSSREEKRGLLFNSVMIPPVPISPVENTLITNPIVIWNYTLNNDNTITINGNIRTSDAASVRVTRKKNDRTFDEDLVFGPYFLNGLSNFSFIDTTVSAGETYIYVGYISSKGGVESKALDDLVIFNTEIKINEISTEIVSPNNSTTNNIPNVTFNLTSNLNRQNSAFILENFRNQGIYDLYSRYFLVTDAPASYAYKVIRKNMNNGLEEDFGILPTSQFNDSTLRVNKNVKPLEAGFTYKYSIYSFLRAADSLLPQLVVTGSYRGKEYYYQPFYSRNPFVLRTGTMITEISLAEQLTNSQYSFGPTGQVLEYYADFANLLPTVKNVIATNKSRTENILEWKVEGNLDLIDHFIIKTQQLSHIRIVGTVHNISETNSFKFYDILTDGESGNLTYMVQPFYYNYTNGQDTSSNTITV